MSWNRFDSHNFMTTVWFIRFSMVNHSLSIVYGLKFNLSITHIPIKMVWTEASHPTDQPTDRPSDWSSKWMILVLKRFLIVFVQWPCQIENIYIWSLRIWCKLKPTKKIPTVIHHCCKRYSPNGVETEVLISTLIEWKRAIAKDTEQKQKEWKKRSTNCSVLSFFPLSFL